MNIINILLRKIEKKDLETKLSSLDSIGERLRFLRKNYLKISRAKLSEKIGIDANMLNKYENGYFEPKADRIKQFAEFYDIPVEYLTGENSNTVLKEDFFLILNLYHYCWNIDHHEVIINNRAEIEIAFYNAAKIVVKALDRLPNSINELCYVRDLFTQDPDFNMLDNLSSDSLIAFFDKKIKYLQNDINNYTRSLDYLGRIIVFGICTKYALNKKEYLEVVDCLTPVINSFIEHKGIDNLNSVA